MPEEKEVCVVRYSALAKEEDLMNSDLFLVVGPYGNTTEAHAALPEIRKGFLKQGWKPDQQDGTIIRDQDGRGWKMKMVPAEDVENQLP